MTEAQWGQRDGLFVFHRNGERIKGSTLRSGWERACKRAGLAGRLVHDLRRTAARSLRQAGVPETVIMRLCGWRTRSMFLRYDVVDEADLARAVAQRFSGNGKTTAKPESAENLPESVSSTST